MNLTPAERLILAQQYRILALLNPAEEDDYLWKADVVMGGYESLYSQLEFAFSDDNVYAEERAKYVRSVLSMYDALIHSAKAHQADLTDAERDQLRFPGFSVNDEAEDKRFAEMLARNERIGYPGVLHDGVQDNHFPTRPIYTRMLEAFEPFKGKSTLSLEEIRMVLNSVRGK